LHLGAYRDEGLGRVGVGSGREVDREGSGEGLRNGERKNAGREREDEEKATTAKTAKGRHG